MNVGLVRALGALLILGGGPKRRSPASRLMLLAIITLSLAPVARAGFVITSTRYDSGLARVVVFSVLNDGTGQTAGTTKVGSLDITMSTNGNPFTFNFKDVDGDGATDANVRGDTLIFPTSQADPMPTGSFIRLGSGPAFFIPQQGTDNGAGKQAFTDPDGDTTPNGNNPVADFTGIHIFTVQGTIPGGGVNANSTPTPFAVAVVPAGTTVTITGFIAAEARKELAVSATDVPEPTGLAAIAMTAGFATFIRRPVRYQIAGN